MSGSSDQAWAATDTARRIADAAAAAAPHEEPAMRTAFGLGVRYELEFRRPAHAREEWPYPL